MTGRILLAALTASLVVGCSVAAPSTEPPGPSTAAETARPTAISPPTPRATEPATPPPTLAPEVLPSDLDPELADAVRLRRSYGLRSDLAYVQAVAKDPRASNDAYGVPVYPEEFEDAQRRFNESMGVAGLVNGYAGSHRDEFGGLYIDEATHAGVVSLWTDHLAEHAAAIHRAVGPDARVAFGQVRYAEADLRVLQDQISEDVREDWIADIPAQFESLGVDIHASQVSLEVSSANPDAVTIIEAHYGLGDRLRVESDGTGRTLIPWGTVIGRVTGIADRGAWQYLSLEWESPDVGSCGGGDMGFGVGDDGRYELPCQAGTRTIIVVGVDAEDTRRELGRGTIEVEPDKTVTLDIRVRAP
jgi:hypothetical protein